MQSLADLKMDAGNITVCTALNGHWRRAAMWTSSSAIPHFCKNSIRIACCMALFWCTPLTGQEPGPNSSAIEVVERNALKLLNDSDLAHTVKPSLQDTPCTYQNPAFPALYPEDKAVAVDAAASTAPPDSIRPDDSEYLVRFQSAKPVQAAIQELLAMGEKWAAYGTASYLVSEDDGPTDLANARYNVADMITIAVLLKQVGPDGTSMFNYGYEDNGYKFPSHTFRIWPCAVLRTRNGEVFARIVPEAFGHNGKSKVLQLSFPRLIDGKPLISNLHEKVEFRLVVNQRVFETTFYINASDVLDGSEKLLYLPSAFTDSNKVAQK
jgi:hypothetical protein